MDMKNVIVITFDCNRELTEQKRNGILHHVVAQVEEPMDAYGEDIDAHTSVIVGKFV